MIIISSNLYLWRCANLRIWTNIRFGSSIFSIPQIRSRRRSQNFLECFCHYKLYSDDFIKIHTRNYEYLRVFVFASATFWNLKSSSHSLRQFSKIKIFASYSLRDKISTFAHLHLFVIIKHKLYFIQIMY